MTPTITTVLCGTAPEVAILTRFPATFLSSHYPYRCSVEHPGVQICRAMNVLDVAPPRA